MKSTIQTLADEVRAILARTTEPMTAREIAEQSELAQHADDVARVLWTMNHRGELIRSINFAGRMTSLLNPAYIHEETSALKAPSSTEHTQTNDPAAPLPETSEQAACASLDGCINSLTGVIPRLLGIDHTRQRRTAFDLDKRLDAIASDIEDALGDAIDADHDKALVKALVAANGAIQRAARILYRRTV